MNPSSGLRANEPSLLVSKLRDNVVSFWGAHPGSPVMDDDLDVPN
jgi:hypothetical protein